MPQLTEDKLRALIFEILSMERKNLRSKAKTDARMSEEIQMHSRLTMQCLCYAIKRIISRNYNLI